MGYLGIAAGILGLLFIGNSPIPEKSKILNNNETIVLNTDES